MNRANILIAVAIGILTIAFWAVLNQPGKEPPWPERIMGFAFSPMRMWQSPVDGVFPSLKEIDEDLALLAGKTHAIRTYTVEDVLAEIPTLAQKHKINVAVGAWLSADLEKNEIELERLFEVVKKNPRNIIRVIVGNEAILRGDLTVEQIVGYVDRVKKVVTVPVSTAEPWHVWFNNKELVAHVDYIATHMLPYWEGVHLDRAVDYVVDHINLLKSTYPGKPIVIGEVGWPSNGRTRHSAVASTANEATFLRRFLARAMEEKYIYYIMEAFDQPWKRASEGAVGAYWGVYNVERRAKFPFTAPIVEIPEWRLLASISVVIAAITFALLLIDSRTLRNRGRSFLALIAFAAATAGVWIVYSYSNQYMTMSSLAVGFLMITGMIGVVVVLFTEAHEWAEAVWTAYRRRPFTPLTVEDKDAPMVSIHVPAYNEPPDMLMETLGALATLEYPRYEVLVIDNNTKDPAVWRPVEAYCKELGPKFRFFHVDPLAGFKAGALNFALGETSPYASVVAVIDSDYVVSPCWLSDLAPQFLNPAVAIVQAPQDYRDEDVNFFKAMCYSEYRGFFYIGMVTRNERNAIIQHGTMTMVRKSALQEVGGWAEWCITEDAELGLSLFELGYEAVYVPVSYGRGLMPDTFEDFKKQRFRWAYGAMRIMEKHTRSLLGGKGTKLTAGQRYHFVAGWLPWIGDGINLLFTMLALFWSMAMTLAPKSVDPPLVSLSTLPLILFVFKIAKMLYLYQSRVGATVAQTLSAALAGLSLSHTVAKAILFGLVTRKMPFFRTPKMAKAHALLQAINSAREEGLFMLALWCSAAAVAFLHGSETLDLLVWVIVLLIQSIPYLASVVVSVISGFSKLPTKIIASMTATPPTPEQILPAK